MPADEDTRQRDQPSLIDSARVVGALTLASRILGLIRDKLCAYYFGIGGAFGAFVVAFTIPNLFRRLFGEGALSAAFVPAFSDEVHRKGKAEAWRLFSGTLATLALVLGAIWVAGEIILAVLGAVGRTGAGGASFQTTVHLTAIMLPYMWFICLVALCMGALNALGHFAIPALAPVVLNIVWIGSLVVIVPRVKGGLGAKITAVAIAIVVGGVAQLALQVPVLLKRGWRPATNLKASLSHPGIRGIALAMAPVAVGIAIRQLNVLCDRLIAIMVVPDGGPSTLFFADRLAQFPLSLVGVSMGVAALAILSRLWAAGDVEKMRDVLARGLRVVLFLAIPAAVGLAVMREPIIELLFQDGRFTAEATGRTSWTVLAYCVGIWAFCANQVLVRAFYAAKDTRTPVKLAVWIVVLNLALNLTLVWRFREAGLALATSLASIVQFAALSVLVEKRTGRIDWRGISRCAAQATLFAGVMGAACYGTLAAVGRLTPGFSLGARAARVVAPVVVGIAVYALGARLAHMPELAAVLRRRRKTG